MKRQLLEIVKEAVQDGKWRKITLKSNSNPKLQGKATHHTNHPHQKISSGNDK
ncbi:MAG: hypothetical protein R2822_08740 [Spirosomataceae bacterium]